MSTALAQESFPESCNMKTATELCSSHVYIVKDPVLNRALSSLPKGKVHPEKSSPARWFPQAAGSCRLFLPLQRDVYHCPWLVVPVIAAKITCFIFHLNFSLFSSYPVGFVIQPPDERLRSCMRQRLWCVTQHFSKTSYLFPERQWEEWPDLPGNDTHPTA